MGTIFFSKSVYDISELCMGFAWDFLTAHELDKLCMDFTWEFSTAHGLDKLCMDLAWDFSTAHGFFRKKCCRRLAGYGNTFPQY